MRAVDQPLSVQDLQIFADGYLRGLELRRQVGNQHPTLMVQHIEDGAAAFFVEQGMVLWRTPAWRDGCVAISFYIVWFRLSRKKRAPALRAPGKLGSRHFLCGRGQFERSSQLVTLLFIGAWEPLGVITNPIPYAKVRLL